MLSILFPILLYQRPLVSALCEQECGNIPSLLAQCSLPPLTTDQNTLPRAKLQNVTGLPHSEFNHDPLTSLVTNLTQARCLCTEARLNLYPCSRCFLTSDDAGLKSNEYELSGRYSHDCEMFGYFRNATLAYPSTTRTNLPVATPPPAPEVTGGPACQEICAVVRGQIEDCGTTPIEAEEKPPSVALDADDILFGNSLLLNRTAAECVCTTQVLRRIPGCSRCIEFLTTPTLLLGLYDFACGDFGYWNTLAPILPSKDDLATSSEKPTPTASSTPTTNAAGRAGVGVVGSLAYPSFVIPCGVLLVLSWHT